MKYFSLTHIGLSVTLPNGRNKRISFSPLSAGGSVYYTNDPDEIYALERHYRYGSLFRRDPNQTPGLDEAGSDSISDQPTPPDSAPPQSLSLQSSEVSPSATPSGKKEIPVTDLDDAREYLCRNHGYSRTKLKFKVDIIRAAERNRIKFVGL